LSSAPDKIAQSDVHEDAVRAFKSLAAKAATLMLTLLLTVMLFVLWRFA
jgi:hypothetical protein